MPFPVLHPKVDCAGPAYSWVSDSRVPGAGTFVLVDTGAIAVAGDYKVITTGAVVSTGAVDLELQLRDAANVATLWYLPMAVWSDVMQQSIDRIAVAAGERLRILTNNGIAATVRTSIQWARVG